MQIERLAPPPFSIGNVELTVFRFFVSSLQT